MRYRKIPEETVRRLPMYLRALMFMPERDHGYVSSKDLAEFLNLKPPQIRKDFSYFGAFGTRGTGYKIDALTEQIRSTLKLNGSQKTVLIGAGKLGAALTLYTGFKMYGFDITAIYDISPKKIGTKIGGITIKDASKLHLLKNKNIKLAIIAVPADTAQETADALVKSGVKGILNLAPCYLRVPKKVKVTTIDIAVELGVLPYYT
jgi:redox-sensing transcriptional repressor